MAAEGSAVFRAIADWKSLRRESRAAAGELRKVRTEARQTRGELERLGTGADQADVGLRRLRKGLEATQGVLKRTAEAADTHWKTAFRGADRVRQVVERVGGAVRENETAVAALTKTQQAAAAVESRLARARRREADTLGAVATAERVLARVRGDIKADADSIATAEERLARARRAHASASDAVVRTEREHATALERAATATDKADASTGRWGKSLQKVRQIATGVVSTVGKAAAVTAALGGAAALAGAAGTAAAGGIIALIGAVGQLSGLVVGLPAILSAAAVGMGVLKLATSGFADAVKDAFGAKTLDEFNKATEGLTPSAKAVARVIFDLRKELRGLKEVAQETFFSGLDKPLRSLIKTYLPDVRRLVGDVASSFNRGAKTVASFLQETDRVKDVRSVMDGIRQGFRNAEGSVKPLTGAVLDLLVVGGRLLPEIGDAITDMSTRFGAFIKRGRETGQLEQFFRNAVTAAKLLGTTLKNVGSIIGTIFEAGRRSGAGFLETLARVTGQVDRFLKAPVGQHALEDLLESAGDLLESFGPVVRELFLALAHDLFPLLADIAQELAPGLVDFIRGLGDGLREAAPGLRKFFDGVSGFLSDLGEAAPELGSLISKIGSDLGPVVDQLGDFVQWLIEMLDRLPPGAIYAVAGAIAAVVLAVKGLAVASSIAGNLDKLGLSLDRTKKKADDATVAIAGDGGGGGAAGGKGKKKGGAGAAVARGGGLLGAIAALGIAAQVMDQINVAAAGGEENLGHFEENLHDIAGAGQQVMSLDLPGIISDIGDEFGQIGSKFAAGESPIGRLFRDLSAATGYWRDSIRTRWQEIQATTGSGALSVLDTMRSFGQSMVVGARLQYDELVSATNGAWAAIQSAGASGGAAFIEASRLTYDIVTGKAKQYGSDVKTTALEIRDAVVYRTNELRDQASAAWDSLTARIGSAVQSAQTAVAGGAATIRDRWSEGMAALGQASDTARSRVDTAMANVRGSLDRVAGFLSGGLTGAVRSMGGVWSEVMGGIERTVTGAVDRIVGALNRVKTLASSVRETAGNVGSRLLGYLPGFSRGGRVPGRGRGTGDDTLAAVRSGEWIINAKASERFAPLLEAINRYGGDGASLLDPHDLYARFTAAAAGGAATSAGLAAAGTVSAPQAAGVANPDAVIMGDVHLEWNEWYPQAEKASVATARRMQRMTRLGLRQALAQSGAGGGRTE